ncbi:hypothetical protein CBOM_02258 [Ceraceosorus bombacis]|uniref:Uncharacterized protein n=1 Tax=Ceraceosorus bombacis TaxID=401625 RepID=A0A0P1BEU8_9BASI|nr:hypothetical protein CBOM_02258 [Ceraceosorus bombacis]
MNQTQVHVAPQDLVSKGPAGTQSTLAKPREHPVPFDSPWDQSASSPASSRDFGSPGAVDWSSDQPAHQFKEELDWLANIDLFGPLHNDPIVPNSLQLTQPSQTASQQLADPSPMDSQASKHSSEKAAAFLRTYASENPTDDTFVLSPLIASQERVEIASQLSYGSTSPSERVASPVSLYHKHDRQAEEHVPVPTAGITSASTTLPKKTCSSAKLSPRATLLGVDNDVVVATHHHFFFGPAACHGLDRLSVHVSALRRPGHPRSYAKERIGHASYSHASSPHLSMRVPPAFLIRVALDNASETALELIVPSSSFSTSSSPALLRPRQLAVPASTFDQNFHRHSVSVSF